VAAGIGLLLSIVSVTRLVTWLVTRSYVPLAFWHLPLVLLTASSLCVVASVVLLVLALTSKAKK
jgi:hypothetical protein